MEHDTKKRPDDLLSKRYRETGEPATARDRLQQWLDDHGAKVLWGMKKPKAGIGRSYTSGFSLTAYQVDDHIIIIQEFGNGKFCEYRSSGSLQVTAALDGLDDLVDEQAGDDMVQYELQEAILSDAEDPANREIIGWQFAGGFVARPFARKTAQHRANKSGRPFRLIRQRTTSRVDDVFKPESNA